MSSEPGTESEPLARLLSRAGASIYKRWVRPWLPGKPVLYAGVRTAYDRKLTDRIVPASWRPWYIEDIPLYESALVDGLKEQVRTGDAVVVVGGGMGITATVAALAAGEQGHVHCFEGAREAIERIRSTVERNGVAARVSIHHAVIGRAVNVSGTRPGDTVVPPGELPECDLLELDCEGAEVDILEALEIRPRVILVETHGTFGAPTARVRSLLEEKGYSVEDRGIAEPRLRTGCERGDIRVLLGTRDQRGI